MFHVKHSDRPKASDSMTDVEIPEGIKDNNAHTVRVQWRGAVTEHLTKHDLVTAREVFHYDVYRWDDVDKDGRRVTITRMDKQGRNVWMYETSYFTRVGCKPCRDFRAQSYGEYYARIGEDGEPFPVCGTHLDGIRRALRGSTDTISVSEPLRIGQH